MSLISHMGRSGGHSVPNTYAQGKAPGTTRPRVARDVQLPPTEIELLRVEIAQMRVEMQERDEWIDTLEDLLTENGIDVP